MATKAEIDRILEKNGALSSQERNLLQGEADNLKGKHRNDVARLRELRAKESHTPAENEEIQEIRNRIGPELKRAANLDRKTGRPVESVR